jgi:hypothetical protein
MRRSLIGVVFLGVILAMVPGSVSAQSPITLSSVQVQLWPEYDQPSMLVILDFQLASGTELPASVAILFPKEANLMAVAMQAPDGSLLNADYLESKDAVDWQSVTVQVQSPTTYRIEYYQPLTRTGQTRAFTFQWPGNLAVQDLGVSVRVPADATNVITDPALQTAQSNDLAQYLAGSFGAQDAGQGVTFNISYSRTSEALTAPQQGLQPTQPLDASTPGRVMISNYLPYLLGALGLILIGGGALYFWQAGRARTPRSARHGGVTHVPPRHAEEMHCHECGTRAREGDRFCRVCGTRLRTAE